MIGKRPCLPTSAVPSRSSTAEPCYSTARGANPWQVDPTRTRNRGAMALGRPEDTRRRRGFLWPDSAEYGSSFRFSQTSGDFHFGDFAANRSATALPEGPKTIPRSAPRIRTSIRLGSVRVFRRRINSEVRTRKPLFSPRSDSSPNNMT
jgi:hypothetical protein